MPPPVPEIRDLLAAEPLPSEFERWRVLLAAGDERPTSAAEWTGALVLVQAGELQVECLAGGSRSFVAGDLLALGWLPLRALRNPGPLETRLLALRRRGDESSPR